MFVACAHLCKMLGPSHAAPTICVSNSAENCETMSDQVRFGLHEVLVCTRAFLVHSNCLHYFHKCNQICCKTLRAQRRRRNKQITFACHFFFWHVRSTLYNFAGHFSFVFFPSFLRFFLFAFVRSDGMQDQERKTFIVFAANLPSANAKEE